MLGGIGPCGRMLCCSTFLGDFEPVSIKMAKDQNLSLNPTKISGLCGRLMCCLKYENDEYETAKEQLPDIGDTIETPNGTGKVVGLNILERVLQVELINRDRVVEYTWEELIQDDAVSMEFTDQRWKTSEQKEIFDAVTLLEEQIGYLYRQLGELKQHIGELIEENQHLKLENDHLRKRMSSFDQMNLKQEELKSAKKKEKSLDIQILAKGMITWQDFIRKDFIFVICIMAV